MNLPSMSGFETTRFRTLTSTCIEYARLEKRPKETIGDTSEFFHRHIAHGRGELGYYGPTYNAAKAATIAPAYFTKTSDEIRDHQTPSNFNAAIDLVLVHVVRSTQYRSGRWPNSPYTATAGRRNRQSSTYVHVPPSRVV